MKMVPVLPIVLKLLSWIQKISLPLDEAKMAWREASYKLESYLPNLTARISPDRVSVLP